MLRQRPSPFPFPSPSPSHPLLLLHPRLLRPASCRNGRPLCTAHKNRYLSSALFQCRLKTEISGRTRNRGCGWKKKLIHKLSFAREAAISWKRTKICATRRNFQVKDLSQKILLYCSGKKKQRKRIQGVLGRKKNWFFLRSNWIFIWMNFGGYAWWNIPEYSISPLVALLQYPLWRAESCSCKIYFRGT